MYDEYWKNVNGTVTVTIQLDGVTKATYTNSANGNLKLQNFGPHNIIFNLCIGDKWGIFNNSWIGKKNYFNSYTRPIPVQPTFLNV